MDKEDVAYMHTMEHYLARKIEGNLAIGDNIGRLRGYKGIMLSKISQIKKEQLHGIAYI